MDIDIFNCDNSELEKSIQPKAVSVEQNSNDSLIVEAIQIVKNVKTTMGNRREIIDTIKVDYPKMTYERALKIAKYKANMLGNCFIVEKCERIVQGY